VERFSTRSLIALRGIPVQKWVARRLRPRLSSPEAPLSPEIYSLSGLVGAVISYWGSTINRHA
jgi:hypothetical protein